MARMQRRKNTKRKKTRIHEQPKCRFGGDPSKVDYKDVATLSKLTTPQGKLFGRKRNGTNAACQRAISRAIKQARFMGLLPYVG